MGLDLVQGILKDLDEDQREGVISTEGPVLIVAGPGSGKTRVITYRFAYIVVTGKALPDEILCVTFTNKAANEMKTRITGLTGICGSSKWWIKTFHSLGLSIIRENCYAFGLSENFVVYDKDDELRLVKNIVKRYNFRELSPERVMEMIDSIRYGRGASGMFGEAIVELSEMYEKEMRKSNAVDFVDLIMLPIRLLRGDERVRKVYQSRWKYIMVDEFQDTDPVQYELIKLLLDPKRNICVVGDDDQSIYGWRGASVENIRNFDKDFENCKIVILKTNYRSTDEIISLSASVASNMVFRREGKVMVGKGVRGSVPVFVETYSQAEEARIIAREIKLLVSRGYAYKDIAVLYRVNYLSRYVEEALIGEGIPYRVYSGVSFYERAEVKDILAYLKFFVNRRDVVSFSRIVNVPRKRIGEKALSGILSFSASEGIDLFESLLVLKERGVVKGEISGLVRAIEILGDESEGSIASRVRKMLDEIRYYDYLREHYDNHEERVENVFELLSVLEEFEVGGGRSIEEFVNTCSIMTGLDEVDETQDRVSLMTLHVSKGLEFPVVFIFGAVDGIIPHFRNIHTASLVDEERRLFYVGITRAKEKLVITASRFVRIGSLKHVFASPSRFVEEISNGVMKMIVSQ